MNAYELADRIVDDFYLIEAAKMLRQQATLIDYYKVRDDSYQKTILKLEKTISELEKEVKELHKIAQIMAMQKSDARKSLQNYKDQIK